MKKQIEKQILAMHKVFDNFNYQDSDKLLKDCLKVIRKKHAIIAGGLGKNVSICEKFIGTLNSLGIDAHFLHINSAVHGDIGVVNKGDMVILLSKSGETEEAIYLSRFLSKRGVSTCLLTCSYGSTLSKVVDRQIVLDIQHEGDKWNIIPNNSSVIFLVFLQALAMEIVNELPISLPAFKRNHPGGSIGKILNKKKNKS